MFDERGFTRTVFADESEYATFGNFETDVVQRDLFAVAMGEILDLDDTAHD